MRLVRTKSGPIQQATRFVKNRLDLGFMIRPDAANAVRQLERALEVQPLDLGLHQQLAQAHYQLLQRDDRELALHAICRELPFAFTSQLHMAALLEARTHWREALIGFTRAIKTAQLRGFWYDEGSTPPWIRDLVLHAMDVAEQGRPVLFHETLEPLIARHGKAELARVSRALAMY